jgi:hypothetical protein
MNQIISVLNKVVLRLKIVAVFCTRGGFISLVSVVSPFLVVLALIRFFVIEGTTVCSYNAVKRLDSNKINLW